VDGGSAVAWRARLRRKLLMHAGFTLVTQNETLEVRVSGSAAQNASPQLSYVTGCDDGALLLGRLHYLNDFSTRFPAASGGSPPSPAALALNAYRTHGLAALEHLEGEFALLVWNRRSRTVLAMRDPMGSYPLFWCARGQNFAISDSVGPLIDILQDASFNLDFVADYLTRPSLALDEPPSEATCYRGVQRIRPGSIVTFRFPHGPVTTTDHWRWRDLIVDPGSDRTEDIADQFDALFRPAVRERIVGRTASHFSGGMDSTAVALVARDWLQTSSGEPLHSLSLKYERLKTLSGETRYIDAALDGQHGITSHLVTADDLLAYDNFANGPVLDEPFPGLLHVAQDRALFDAAARAGVQSILTGEGGDDLLDVPPFMIATLLRRGHVREAWRESARSARAYATDPWQVFYQFGVEHLLPLRLRAGVSAMLRGGRVDWSRQGLGTIAPWIRRDFARKYDLRGRTLDQLSRSFRSTRDVGLSVALAGIQCRVGDRHRSALASPLGMTLSHPFTDPRLLRLGLGIRLRYRQDPARQKPLLAHAMRDVLPVEICKRRGKAHFNEVYFRGLSRNRPLLERLIRDAPIDDLEIIDKEMLISCLRQTTMGVEFSPNGSLQIDLALSLVAWLTQNQTARSSRDGLGSAQRSILPTAAAA
jgi:asparagine synthase (glutamine-hydrolysing)